MGCFQSKTAHLPSPDQEPPPQETNVDLVPAWIGGEVETVVGSDTAPPRHWRRKAKVARERGRTVRRKISLERKDWEEDGVVEEERRGAERWWWWGKRKTMEV